MKWGSLFDWLSRQLVGLTDFADAIHLLKPVATAMTDKSAKIYFGKILKVYGHEMVTKNSRDIQGPALAIVLERVKPYGASHDTYESARTISTGPPSKGGSKIGKANGYTSVSKHRSRDVSMSDLMKYFREDLYRRLLSTDFKKQVDGIEMLQKTLPSISKEITEVLDILLRWFVLRFCESNMSCLLKMLEFLPELFDTLRNERYIMTESEAAILFPCLFEKSGHNIEKVREKMRELTKQIIHTYSAAKTFPYVLEGLRSRNNRTQMECVDLVGYLLDNHGAEISGGN